MTSRKQMLDELMDSADAVRRRLFMGTAWTASPITPQQWMLVRILMRHPDRTVKDIAQMMHMSSSAATQLVDKLVKRRFVTRKTALDDRRAVVLALSPKTAAAVKKMKAEVTHRMIGVCKALSDKELAQFVALHRKMAAEVRKQ